MPNATKENPLAELKDPIQSTDPSLPRKQQIKIKPFRFRKSYTISKETQEMLHQVHGMFAANLAKTLQPLLNKNLIIELLDTQKMSLRQHLSSLSHPTFMATMDIQPINSMGFIDINSIIVYSAINKMLGGDGTVPVYAPQMHHLEMAFVRKFFNLILNDLNLTWKAFQSLSFTLDEIHTNPSAISEFKLDEIVLVSTLKVSIGSARGLITVALLARYFGPLMGYLETQQEENPIVSSKQINLESLEVDLTAILGTVELSKQELQDLQPGDILPFNNEFIDFRISGESKFKAIPGLNGKHKAILLQSPVPTQDV